MKTNILRWLFLVVICITMISCQQTYDESINYQATIVYQTKVVKIGGYEPKIDSITKIEKIQIYDINKDDEIIVNANTITTYNGRQFITMIEIQSNNSNKTNIVIDWFKEDLLEYDTNIQYKIINTIVNLN